MSERILPDWIAAFIEYASVGEAPPQMYFWTAVSTVAGALRRRVWLDMGHFKWLSNFYILLVAPPGIVSKSTTASIGMNLLRRVPGVNFGPDVVTWQALVQSLAASAEAYEKDGTFFTMSALTIESSELGNFMNPQDREMIDLLVNLWDGKEGQIKKVSKTQGNDTIKNPWINIIGCTTPSWMSNFPEYVISGGLFSRTVLVYADEKAKYVAYPILSIPKDFEQQGNALVHDLEHISQLAGPFTITSSGYAWGEEWYLNHWQHRPAYLDNERFGGYIARKQTHLHKLAMVLSAAKRDDLIISEVELAAAETILTANEKAMPATFEQVGRSEESAHTTELMHYVKAHGVVDYRELFRSMMRIYPDSHKFDIAVNSLYDAGLIEIQRGDSVKLRWKQP